jgi:hypothetical protein
MIWDHSGSSFSESSWSQQTYDLSAVADGAATVYVRWSMGPTDGSVTYPGWNIDDVEIWGEPQLEPSSADLNADGAVDLFDYTIMSACMTGPAGSLPTHCDCADIDSDGDADVSDFSTLQVELTIE